MSRKILITAIVLFVAVIVNAQPPGGQFDRAEMVRMQTEQMVTDLGLNDEQAEKVGALNKKYSEKMGELFQQSAGDREKMRENMQKLREDKDEELKEVLTPEQFKKHQEIEAKRMEEFRQRGGQGNRPGGERGGQRGGQRGNAR